jgi:hypothetical protein
MSLTGSYLMAGDATGDGTLICRVQFGHAVYSTAAMHVSMSRDALTNMARWAGVWCSSLAHVMDGFLGRG